MDRLMSCNGGNFPLLLLCPTSIRFVCAAAHEKKMAIEAHALENPSRKKDTLTLFSPTTHMYMFS